MVKINLIHLQNLGQLHETKCQNDYHMSGIFPFFFLWLVQVFSTYIIFSLNFLFPLGLGTPELHAFETFICGSLAGVIASVVTQPADVVKTRLQLFPHKYSSTGSAVYCILKVRVS